MNFWEEQQNWRRSFWEKKLEQHRHNLAAVADDAGVNRTWLYRHLVQVGVSVVSHRKRYGGNKGWREMGRATGSAGGSHG